MPYAEPLEKPRRIFLRLSFGFAPLHHTVQGPARSTCKYSALRHKFPIFYYLFFGFTCDVACLAGRHMTLWLHNVEKIMLKKCWAEFSKGIIRENPIFFIVLGLCPTLAVSTNVPNALGMGFAATFVLLFSNIFISLIRNVIPDKIRIPCFIVVIATFVSIVELVLKAYLPALDKSLGIFVPLIVVNCIIMGRAEAFASKNPVLLSIFDGLGMGLGFTLALLVVSIIRETVGMGKLAGYSLSHNFDPANVIALAPGALLVLGLLIGGIRWLKSLRSS